MKEINLLFLAPHWRVSLIDAFKEAVTKLSSVAGKVVAADSDPLAPALKVADLGFPIPPFTHPECLEAVMDLCRRESIRAVIPLTNKAIEFLDRHRKQFYDPGLLIYLQKPEVIELCHDKLKLARTFTASGIPAPDTWGADEVSEVSQFPLIAKARRGEGGKNRHKIEDRHELIFYAAKYPHHVFQQFIQGREYTIDWFSDQHGKPFLIVPRERLAVRGGEVTVSRIHLQKEIIDAARKAGSRVGLHGPCNLQGILDASGRFWFTDVNLRFGSGSTHTIAAGGDMPMMIYKELELGSPESALFPIKDHSMMTRYYDAFFIEPS